jgi:phage terminase large subunit-like protein
MGKRRRSLGVVISTQAPSDDHPLSQLIDDGLSGQDPSVLVRLTAAPEDADPFDPEVIRAANPAMGVFLDERDVMSEAQRARRIPAMEPAFRNLRLNQRVDARTEDRIVPAPVWRQCNGPVDRAALRGRRAFGGLDLSGAEDLTSLVLAIPDDRDDRGYDVIPFFWTPTERIEARPPAERDLFRQWINQGLIIPVPGPVIRMDYIVGQLAQLKQEFDLEVAYDRWGIKRLQQEMADEGLTLPMEPFGQGWADMDPALRYLIELLLGNRIRHGGHPVLTSCMANAIVVTDGAGNRKVDKGRSNMRSSTRIDGAVALAMSVGLAQLRLVAPSKGNMDWLTRVVAA